MYFFLCIIPLFIILGLYLSGITYFMLFGANIDTVTPYTIIEQWRDYHDDSRYQASLTLALIAGFILPIILPLIAIIAHLSKKESLHGEARWAKLSEITNDYALTKKRISMMAKGY